MATTVSWATVFDRLVDNQAAGFGIKFTGTATMSTNTVTTTDPRIGAGGDNQATQKYEGRQLYIPGAASAADQKRGVLQIDTTEATGSTSITCLGPNFSATETDESVYILGEDPDVIRSIGNDALKELHFPAQLPLKHGPLDGDMQESGVTNWTATNATRAKTSTASSVWSMAQAMTVTDDGNFGGGYVESALNAVHANTQVSVYLIAKGDGRLQVLDASDNVLETISFDTEHWVFGTEQFTPSVSQIKFRLVSDDVSGVTTWQGAWFVRESDTKYRLPAWMGDKLVVRNIIQNNFWETISDGSGDLYAADSAIPRSLRKGVDWQPYYFPGDANVRTVELIRGHYTGGQPLFVVVDCPYSAPYGVSATLDTFTSTTVCPEDLLLAKVKNLMGRYYPQTWPELEGQGLAELAAQQSTVEMDNYEPLPRNGFAAAFRGWR